MFREMKKKFLFSMAAAAMLLAACSSDDIVAPVTEGGAQWNAEGQGYVSLAINLPTQPQMVKAFSGEEVFDDGKPEEYDVEDAALIIFKGTDEASATIEAGYDLDTKWQQETSSSQITTTSKIVQQINSIESSDENLYALVVLNRNNAFTIEDGGVIKVNGTEADGMTLAAFNAAVAEAMTGDWHTNGFLMSNAPLSDMVGGATAPTGAVITTLTEFDASKIKGTELEASNDVAANIYVERAVAKVTVSGTTSGDVDNLEGVSYNVLGWQLDNTTTKSNLVREVGTSPAWVAYTSEYCSPAAYRFVGGSAVGTTIDNANLYRTYWGEDLDYSVDATLNTVGGLTIADEDVIGADGEAAAYCFENTSDLEHMLEKNMTRVIVKAQLGGNSDFYVINGDKEVMYTEDEMKDAVLSVFMNGTEGKAWIAENVAATTDATTISGSDFEVEMENKSAGIVTVTNINVVEASQSKFNENVTAVSSEVVAAVNSDITIDLYDNGAAYYPVYVAHFGEGETPWADVESVAVDNIYPGGEQNYLGRWAMVRNNWYDITITGIKGIGSSTVPEVTVEPIDKLESYIGVQINILSWAKRAQSVEL